MNINNVKAVIFDLDDTLYDFKGVEYVALLAVERYCKKYLNIDKNTFKEAFHKGKEYTKTLLGNVAASHNRLLYFQHTLEILNLPVLPHSINMSELFWDTILANIKLFDGVIELMQTLKVLEIKTAICTDLTAEIQCKKIEKLGLNNYVDVLVTSEEVGVEKPDKRMFEMTLRKLGFATKECIFLGDSLVKDICGSGAIGIKAYISSSSIFLKVKTELEKHGGLV